MNLNINSTLSSENIPFKLPKNWRWYKWGDLITGFQQGLIRSNRELTEHGTAYLKMNNLSSQGTYDLNNLSYTKADKGEIHKYRLNKGDFLINVRNSKELVGKTCVIANHDFDILFNHMLVRVKHLEGISGSYINALLNVPVMRRFIDRCKSGTTTVIALYQRDLFEIPIPLPDQLTHDSIVSLVESFSSKIELNNRINGELEAMAKAVYDYWFVQFDFPDGSGRPYRSSGGRMVWNAALRREVPEGWEVGRLGDVVEINPTLSLKAGKEASYFDMDALPTEGFMTKEKQVKPYGGGVKFQNGDVVVARITPCLENGKTGLITLLEDGEIGFGSTEFIILRGKKQQLSAFAAFVSRSDLFRKYAIGNMLGTSGRKRVEGKTIGLFPLAIPSDSILARFEELAAPIFEKMTSNTKENQQLSQLRDWLLPMLMNGQVRV